ncbi:MAG: hypothetical protein ABIT38_05425, partial [Gemmatimonadaceae bacterium]
MHMKGAVIVSLTALFAWVTPPSLVHAQSNASAVSSDTVIAITHVHVVDVESGALHRDQTVVVRGTRIVALGSARTVLIPGGATRVDGRGRFLIPGLWDMHAHTVMPGGERVLALYVANGVTGLRDMAGDWAQIVRWRGEIARGERVGPRIIAAGPYIEGGDVPIPHILARTPAEARAAVDSLVALGVDFVKLHSQLSREVFLAAGSRARERGIPYAGHVPRSITAAEASDSGQRSLEHLLQIPNVCTPAESVALAPRFPVQSVMGRCTSTSLAPLWARFVRNRTWIVPTLVAQYEVAHWPRRDLPGDEYGPYLPESLRRYVASIFPMPDSVPPDANMVGEALFAKRVAIVGEMHRAGVAVMPGTDAPLRNSPPGFGLHAELALFVRGGMSNADVLRAATLEPARYFAATDTLGSVA